MLPLHRKRRFAGFAALLLIGALLNTATFAPAWAAFTTFGNFTTSLDDLATFDDDGP